MKHLALPADARNMKVKSRLPVPSIATSGRWNKRSDGEWGFDFDEEPASGGDACEQVDALAAAADSGHLKFGQVSEDEDELDQCTISKEANTHGSITNSAVPLGSSQPLSANEAVRESGTDLLFMLGVGNSKSNETRREK